MGLKVMSQAFLATLLNRNIPEQWIQPSAQLLNLEVEFHCPGVEKTGEREVLWG